VVKPFEVSPGPPLPSLPHTRASSNYLWTGWTQEDIESGSWVVSALVNAGQAVCIHAARPSISTKLPEDESLRRFQLELIPMLSHWDWSQVPDGAIRIVATFKSAGTTAAYGWHEGKYETMDERFMRLHSQERKENE